MQAFVACLRDDPLEELIEVGAEAWEFRGQGASPQMIAHLESLFLGKTIDRLDPAGALLLEFLSVYRNTFPIEVIRASIRQGSRLEIVKDALTSRFILTRHGSQYSLNPIARQLSLARIGQEPRRRLAAYNIAADHYIKRVHPTNDRARVRAGADFIEARYHLLHANRESEFQRLAGDYRQLLLRNYRNLEDVPTNPGTAVQVLATLMAALYDVEGGSAASERSWRNCWLTGAVRMTTGWPTGRLVSQRERREIEGHGCFAWAWRLSSILLGRSLALQIKR